MGDIMEYRGQIRTSEINQLFEKVARKNYGKYLYEMNLAHIRRFDNQAIKLEFPVTAVIGPNGGGKTTILGAAACAYKETKPGRFFPKSGKYDDCMQHWKIEYRIGDKGVNPRNEISRTAIFSNYKWTRDGLLSRNTLIFGVSRTVPATERTELKVFANSKFEMPNENIVKLEETICEKVGRILDKDISEFSRVESTSNTRLNMLTGMTNDGGSYTEFHFGAGESSIIRMITEIETCEENSLVLIEEIENGLHPMAVIRLVEYLIDVSLRKKLQVIFTTHSNEALMPLPDKAVWVSINNKVFQGKLDIYSLRAITGQISSQLVIFVEDLFAKRWIESIINLDKTIIPNSIEVHLMEGDGTAVSVHNYHNQDPSISVPSICYIDGDSSQDDNFEKRIFRLPGEMPETYIFLNIMEKLEEVLGILTVALHQPYSYQERIREVLNEVWMQTRDKHILYSAIGEKLGFISEETVRSAFLTTWGRSNEEQVQAILTIIKGELNRKR